MRERASLIGGSFFITGSPHVGTTLCVTVPVQTAATLERKAATNEAFIDTSMISR
jgi:signal transduction histidine kinase